MPIISGGKVIEGVASREYGPYTSAGVPASGYLNDVAQKGALVIDTTNGTLYQNTGTLSATVWTAR
jgi:hypothetical protein